MRSGGRSGIVVAGHVCLDVIPELAADTPLAPGSLVEAGRASFASGGAVANVGLSLARLGYKPILLGRLGDDHFGEVLSAELSSSGADTTNLTRVRGESTSYSIVINRPGRDRTFLHHPGCNESFRPSELQSQRWSLAPLLHFGYPPLMRAVYSDGGAALAAAFGALREKGVTISLDMAMPDPQGPSGRVDWTSFLATVLPQVDLFLPSWQEIGFMLDPEAAAAEPTGKRLAHTAERLLTYGPAVVALKLGERGLYMRTAGRERLAAAGQCAPPDDWADRELLSPNFRVAARGTTGAGDATIAGLLAALAEEVPIAEAASMASAVGACSVEGVNAVEGVRDWASTRDRIAAGWERALSGESAGGRGGDLAESPGAGIGVAGGWIGVEAAGFDDSTGGGWRQEPASGVLLGPTDSMSRRG